MWSDYLLIFSQVVWISAIFEKGKFGGLLSVFLVLLLVIGCLGVSERCSYFRLNHHVHFVF